VAFLLSLFLMPETRKISMWKPEEVGAARAWPAAYRSRARRP